MPNKIRNVMSLAYADSANAISRAIQQRTYDVETDSEIVHDTTQVVGTSHELISAGDATDEVFARIENLSATATIKIGGDASTVFVPWFAIKPGDPPAIIPRVEALADTYVQSSAASTPVRVTLCKIVAPS